MSDIYVECVSCGGNGERFAGQASDGGEIWHKCHRCNGTGEVRAYAVDQRLGRRSLFRLDSSS